jgi:hypothetical protein
MIHNAALRSIAIRAVTLRSASHLSVLKEQIRMNGSDDTQIGF